MIQDCVVAGIRRLNSADCAGSGLDAERCINLPTAKRRSFRISQSRWFSATVFRGSGRKFNAAFGCERAEKPWIWGATVRRNLRVVAFLFVGRRR